MGGSIVVRSPQVSVRGIHGACDGEREALEGGAVECGGRWTFSCGFLPPQGGRCAIPAEVEGRGHAEREGRKRPGTLSLGKIH